MENPKLVDLFSYAFAVLILILGFFLFYSQTNEFTGSLGAAVLAAALAWVSYILMRWLILSLK